MDHYSQLEEKILSRVQPGSVVVTDFDGTVFRGDITFGQPGLMPGMMTVLEQSGMKPIYPNKLPNMTEIVQMYGDFPQYNSVYNLSVFSGHPIQKIKKIAISKYYSFYHQFIDQRLLKLLREVQQKGGQVVILTASPKLYLSGFMDQNPGFQVIGVETVAINGKVSAQPTCIPWGPGKLNVVQSLINSGKDIIAGFGNPDGNDLPWLKLLAGNGKIAIVVDDQYHWDLI